MVTPKRRRATDVGPSRRVGCDCGWAPLRPGQDHELEADQWFSNNSRFTTHRRHRGARIVGGLLTLVVVGLFAYQLNRLVDDLGGSLSDALDTGFYLAAIGGLVAFVSGFLPSGWMRRRTVETEVGHPDDR
jgi:hypothetical protein